LLDPHAAGVVFVLVDMAAGSVTIAAAVWLQPFASVTVTVYVPAPKPFSEAPVPPEGNQE
jgi:hypothetical protein